MNKKFSIINKAFKKAFLSIEEKQRIWTRVDTYVGEHSITTHDAEFSHVSRWHILSPYFLHTQHLAVFVAALVFILGGSTSLAAQHSLPNDALYGIKVNVNEEVRSWFSIGAESKAYFETKRASERLEEAKTLAIMGELDTSAKDKIKKNFQRHTEKVQEQIATIEASNDLKVAIDISENFEHSLKEQSRSLSKIEESQKRDTLALVKTASIEDISTTRMKKTTNTGVQGDDITTHLVAMGKVVDPSFETTLITEVSTASLFVTDTESDLNDIVKSIEENISASVRVREVVQAKVTTSGTIETRKSIAEDTKKDALVQIEKTGSLFFASTTMFVSIDSINLASTTLFHAHSLVVEGDKKFETRQYGEAFTLFRSAFDVATEAEEIILKEIISLDSTGNIVTEAEVAENSPRATSTQKNLSKENSKNRLQGSVIQSI